VSAERRCVLVRPADGSSRHRRRRGGSRGREERARCHPRQRRRSGPMHDDDALRGYNSPEGFGRDRDPLPGPARL